VRIRFLILSLAALAAISLAQNAPDKAAPDKAAPDASSANKSSPGSASPGNSSSDKSAAPNPPQNPDEASSSRDTRVDLTPPKDDDKNHPNSKAAAADLEPSDKPDTTPDTSGVQEFHPWNPMKAIKDIEVGDYYFKLKNYKGALDRYKEALYYKDGDAVASFRIAKCQEKLGDKADAKKFYEQYLTIVPDGPYAKEAHASLDKLAKTR
jgi:tetratricopeptide (TPR) repeat protein